MFRAASAPEPIHDLVVADDPIPLSVLALDLPEPGEGWAAFLAAHNITVSADDIGRPSVARADAKMLLAERRQADEAAQRKREAAEWEAIEADQRRRAQIWRGVPFDQMPPGMPAAVMLQVAHDAEPRRVSPVEEALSGTDLGDDPLASFCGG